MSEGKRENYMVLHRNWIIRKERSKNGTLMYMDTVRLHHPIKTKLYGFARTIYYRRLHRNWIIRKERSNIKTLMYMDTVSFFIQSKLSCTVSPELCTIARFPISLRYSHYDNELINLPTLLGHIKTQSTQRPPLV